MIARAVAAGITPAELRAAAKAKPDKPVAWYVQRAIGRRADAAGDGSAPAPQGAAVDPAAQALAAELKRLDDCITDVQHRVRFGMGISPEQGAAQIAALRRQVAALTEGVSA